MAQSGDGTMTMFSLIEVPRLVMKMVLGFESRFHLF
jgi:hypothetical protein